MYYIAGTLERLDIWYDYSIEKIVFIAFKRTIYDLFWIQYGKFWSGHGDTVSDGRVLVVLCWESVFSSLFSPLDYTYNFHFLMSLLDAFDFTF